MVLVRFLSTSITPRCVLATELLIRCFRPSSFAALILLKITFLDSRPRPRRLADSRYHSLAACRKVKMMLMFATEWRSCMGIRQMIGGSGNNVSIHTLPGFYFPGWKFGNFICTSHGKASQDLWLPPHAKKTVVTIRGSCPESKA